MNIIAKRGFVIVLVIALMSTLILMAGVFINLGCGEALQTMRRSNLSTAYYVSLAGAERMYVTLNGQLGKTVIFPQTITGSLAVSGDSVGSFTATAYTIQTNAVLGIVSTGTVNVNNKATVTVKYGYKADLTTPLTAGSSGDVTLHGFEDPKFPGNPKKATVVNIEGPLCYGGTLTSDGSPLANIVGETLQNQSLPKANFWLDDREHFDITKTGFAFSDKDENGVATGKVTEAQAIEQSGTNDHNDSKLSTFYINDLNDDLVIDEKDAFINYYTNYLDSPTCPANTLGVDLGISPSDIGSPNCHYYEGDQIFNPNSVPQGTPIIFVDGNVYITRSDTKWWDTNSHTIVATGTITIVQPKDGADDTLTLIAYGDVITGGKDVGGQINGNLVVWAKGDFVADYGGVFNAAIIAENGITVETLDCKNKYDRYINPYKGEWVAPLGLPPGYPITTTNFQLMSEQTGGYRPVWQRR